MCGYITPFDTKTKFVILMHPKEFKKTKNNTGRFTHLSLKNSELIVGASFANNRRVNELIDDSASECYVLYPSEDAINLNSEKALHVNRQNIIFIIDSTWACSKSMFRLSPNLQALKKISFTHTKTSQYKIKKQPEKQYLSTIESTLCVLELLNKNGYEEIAQKSLKNFLEPFKEMIKYQLKCVEGEGRVIRYKEHTTDKHH